MSRPVRRRLGRPRAALTGLALVAAACTGRTVSPVETAAGLEPVPAGRSVPTGDLCEADPGVAVLDCGVMPLVAADERGCATRAVVSVTGPPCRQAGDLGGVRVGWRVERRADRRVVTVYRGDDATLAPVVAADSASEGWQTAEVCRADVSGDGATDVVVLLLDIRNELAVHVVDLATAANPPATVSMRETATQRVGTRGCALAEFLDADFARHRLTIA